ncbi:MAG: sigma 54-interacting transcriptional regulator [bacterium]
MAERTSPEKKLNPAADPGWTQLILDSIADGVFTVDQDGRITSFNRAAEQITGFSRHEAIGQFCHEIFRANICFEDCPLRRTAQTQERIVNLEVNILNRENREVPISISTAQIRDQKGRVIGAVETFRDLSLIHQLQEEISGRYRFQDIVSRSKSFSRIFQVLPDIALSDATVLLHGESGTGKELFASAIHQLSRRKKGPFIKVNCGALPETLLESELFGYKKGAFTDAKTDKPGRFKLAEGGTLFLDEVGDLSLGTQVKLLRVLERKEYEPLGGVRTERADVRIVAATNLVLEELVARRRFREDLYYRLNVVRIDIPPLRERREDIPLLIDHFLHRLNRRLGKQVRGVSEKALRILLDHNYPGNVRELQNILEHAMILCKGVEIQPRHLPTYLTHSSPSRPVPAVDKPGSMVLREKEKEAIVCVLQRHRGRIASAARDLGIHRSTLWRKMKRLGISEEFVAEMQQLH